MVISCAWLWQYVYQFSRLLYNAGRCFVQFVMPLSVVVGVYISIFWRLLHRPVSQHSENHRRRRRTNIMIISVSVTFFLSWLPLNTINFMLDLKKEEIAVNNQSSFAHSSSKEDFLHVIFHYRSMGNLKVSIPWFMVFVLSWVWPMPVSIPFCMDTSMKVFEKNTKICSNSYPGSIYIPKQLDRTIMPIIMVILCSNIALLLDPYIVVF